MRREADFPGEPNTIGELMTDPTLETTPTRDEAVLLPCPFCGGKNIDPEGWASIDRKGPACDDCSGCADTVELWNSRPLASAPAPATGGVDAVALREICEDMLDMHHGRQASMDVDAPSFGRGAAAGWDAAVSAFYKRALASLSPAATPVSEAGGEPDMRRVCEALGFDPTNHHNAAKCPYCNPDQADAPKLTYRSTQATTCASCGEHKHTPLRRDEMGGYVCLTCIDKRLAALAQPASSPAGGLDVRFDALYDAFKRGVAWGREMPDAVGPEIEKGAYDYADKNTPPLSQSTSAGRVGG